MLNYARKAWPFALLLCLLYFYSNEIWRSSKDTHTPENKTRTEHPKYESKHDNILADAWNWTTQEPVSFYTFVLAIFTGVLGVTAIVQIRYLRRADETAVISANAARDAANASVDAAAASDRQAKIAEAALTQLERPYIFIFGVHRFGRNQRTGEFSVHYTVANYGKIPAIIEQPHIGFVIDNRSWPPVPVLVDESHKLLTHPILQPGEIREFSEPLPDGFTDGSITVELNEDKAPTGNVWPVLTETDGFQTFFRGVIHYRGPFTKGHETSATWWYFPERHEFVLRGGDEYNYVK